MTADADGDDELDIGWESTVHSHSTASPSAQSLPVLVLGATSYDVFTAMDVVTEVDIVKARNAARNFAEALAFSLIDKTRIATAVSELARNTLIHGGGGTMEVSKAEDGAKIGVRCVFVDTGPGIADIERAMEKGFTTYAGSLGHGLSGTKQLMDQFTIDSAVGEGTRVEIVKWK